MVAVNATAAYVAGTYNTVMRTLDAGRNWRQLHPPVAGEWNDVCMTQFGAGWLVRASHVCWMPGPGAYRKSRTLLSPQEMLITTTRQVGKAGVIVRTVDGGNTWTQQASGTSRDLHGLYCAEDGRYAWAVGAGGTILHTFTYGQTWVSQASCAPGNDLHTVAFYPDGSREGHVGGLLGTICYTVSAGNAWELRGLPYSMNTASTTFLGSTSPGLAKAWMVGTNGALIKFNGASTGSRTCLTASIRSDRVPFATHLMS